MQQRMPATVKPEEEEDEEELEIELVHYMVCSWKSAQTGVIANIELATQVFHFVCLLFSGLFLHI